LNNINLFKLLLLIGISTIAGVLLCCYEVSAVGPGDQENMTSEEYFPARPQQDKPYTLSINGNKHLTAKELLKAAALELQLFEQKGYRKADIDDAAYQMRTAYLQAGYAFAQVDYTYEHQNDKVAVEFRVDEGPRVFIESINFAGNSYVNSDTLNDFFKDLSKARAAQQKRIFIESEVKNAVSRIREYYRGEGFVDAVVHKPKFNFSENRSGVAITVSVEEGPQYFIKDVVLRGDLLPELSQELDEIKRNFINKTYFIRRKLMLRTRLDEVYDAKGYANTEFDIKVVNLAETGRVNLEVDITGAEKIRIADVLISGNTSTRESFIRQRLELQPGNIYTNAKRLKSFSNLYDTGLFSKIAIKLSDPRQDGSRDLEVKVKEVSSREYYLEPGWGSYEELRLGAGIYERNLWGIGRTGRLDGLISTKSETLTLSYTDPWLLQTDITMNVPLNYEHREEPSYTSEEIGISVLFSRKFSENLTLGAGYEYKVTQLFSLTDESPLPRGDEDYNKGTISLQAVWDTRNDIFYPSQGLRLASTFDISLPTLGSDLEYGRITLGCRYFWELPHEYILGLRATTGLIIPLADQVSIPISERFFNGGDNTVRSYKHSRLGPKDENNEPIGGLGYNVLSVELRKRFYKNFSTTIYVDAGNVSPNRSLLEEGFIGYTSRSELMDDTLNDFFSEFKFGIGIGLQYLLPVGPIRFDIAYNPNPEEIWAEDTWVYHFSLGMAF
jgi:outer membrane protein insertion porin family